MLLYFENERPLKGMIAYLDWRFNGHFTHLLETQILTGREGEALYTPLKWNNDTYHFIVMGAGPLPPQGNRPSNTQKILDKAIELAGQLKLDALGVSAQDWSLQESTDKKLEKKLEERKICILN